VAGNTKPRAATVAISQEKSRKDDTAQISPEMMAVAAKLCRLASYGTRNPRQTISSPSTVAQSLTTGIVTVKTKHNAMFAQGFIGPSPKSLENLS
jgi:hypothetical protein